ncbi:MAG: hypothetical protein F6K58_09320 [Symploca sp. SIO2E9]|nr:hypothetical protein [Symploca sp. SIO2E9]
MLRLIKISAVLLVIAFCAITIDCGSAEAQNITQGQLNTVCFEALGIRSGQSQTDTKGAGYGMDNGEISMACVRQSKTKWDELLQGTIKYIKEYPASDERYLLVLKTCRGTGEAYENTFRKCNSITSPTIIAASDQLRGYTQTQLIEFVMKNIKES